MSSYARRSPLADVSSDWAAAPVVQHAPDAMSGGPAAAGLFGDTPVLDQMAQAQLGSSSGAEVLKGGVFDELIQGVERRVRDMVQMEKFKEQMAASGLPEAEQAKALETYQSILSGSGALSVSSEHPSGHEAGMDFRYARMDDIAKMMSTQQGRDLLAKMNDSEEMKGHSTTIRYEYGKNSARPHEHAHEYDGVGTDSTINFSQTENRVNERFTDDGKDLVTTTDTTLFHELIHAYHQNRGTAARGSTGRDGDIHPDDRMLCRAEHQAVGLHDHADAEFSENRYREQMRAAGYSESEYMERDHYSPLPIGERPEGSSTTRIHKTDKHCGG